MSTALDNVTDERIRDYYRQHVPFESVAKLAEADGYQLDPKSGLFFREVLSPEVMENLGHRPFTLIDIMFPRPTDFHHHEDVDETIILLGSKNPYSSGIYLCMEKVGFFSRRPGEKIHIPRGMSHGFTPEDGYVLEVRVACSGILDPTKEIKEADFDSNWLQKYM